MEVSVFTTESDVGDNEARQRYEKQVKQNQLLREVAEMSKKYQRSTSKESDQSILENDVNKIDNMCNLPTYSKENQELAQHSPIIVISSSNDCSVIGKHILFLKY